MPRTPRTTFHRFAAATASAAALSMTATPAISADLPQSSQRALSGGVSAPLAYHGAAENVEHRRWRRDRGGVDVGDVLAGVLILGTIAAVASAASQDRDDTHYPADYPDQRPRYPGEQSRGLDTAVDMCVDEIERGQDYVDSVDNVSRTAEGWYVSGSIENGATFDCRIDNDGRIRLIDFGRYNASYDDRQSYDDRPSYTEVEDNQWGDDVYARARAQQRSAAIDDDIPAGDGRYDLTDAPDFEQGG